MEELTSGNLTVALTLCGGLAGQMHEVCHSPPTIKKWASINGEPSSPIRDSCDFVGFGGAKQLILAVGDTGGGRCDDDVIWGGAMLRLTPGAAAQPVVVTSPPGKPAIAATRDRPRLNDPQTIGGTPDRPFLFKLPVSGEGPVDIHREESTERSGS